MTRTFKISGQKLAQARVANYLSQEKLGAAIGVTGGNIARIEQSLEPSGMYLKQLPKLAAALKMSAQDVLKKLAPEDSPKRRLIVLLTDQNGNHTYLPDDVIQKLIADAERFLCAGDGDNP